MLTVALALAGCSADITRFDFPGFALTEGGNGSGGPPLPSRPLSGVGAGSLTAEPDENPSSSSVNVPPRSGRSSDVQVSALPEHAPVTAGVPSQVSAPLRSEPRRFAPPPPSSPVNTAPAAASAKGPAAAAAKGDVIEVQQGDTLYGLSKRHKVSISELMSLNELKSPSLKPGQTLHLPAGKRPPASGTQRPPNKAEATAAVPAASVRTPVAEGSARGTPAEAVDWSGSYAVKPGDSLYAIAHRYKVRLAELQRVNSISEPRKVRPGTLIKVPAAAGERVAPANPSAPAIAVAPPSPVSNGVAPRTAGSPQPTIINAPPADVVPEKAERVASVASTPTAVNEATPPPAARGSEPQPRSAPTEQIAAAAPAARLPGGKLRWPVKGKVISGFGPRSDGTHNDGVNLAVPLGADVHAAEAGVVAYAGSELKGYGNLVLIRHDSGWVTAYAHNDLLLVKRGDKIKRGQIVAKAGKTGTVDQPQVHFELRQGSKPIDPAPHMEKH